MAATEDAATRRRACQSGDGVHFGTSSSRSARLDPRLPGAGEHLALLVEERRARIELASVLAERPRDDDAALSVRRQAPELGRHPPEDDLAAARRADGPRPRAVDRRPDDLRGDVARRPRRRLQPVAERPDVDPEAVAVVANAACEALVEPVGREPHVLRCRRLGLGHRRAGAAARRRPRRGPPRRRRPRRPAAPPSRLAPRLPAGDRAAAAAAASPRPARPGTRRGARTSSRRYRSRAGRGTAARS